MSEQSKPQDGDDLKPGAEVRPKDSRIADARWTGTVLTYPNGKAIVEVFFPWFDRSNPFTCRVDSITTEFDPQVDRRRYSRSYYEAKRA